MVKTTRLKNKQMNNNNNNKTLNKWEKKNPLSKEMIEQNTTFLSEHQTKI